MSELFWTEERVEKLKAMRESGASHGFIAKEFGVSRNTIVGKCKRKGFDFPGKPTQSLVVPAKPRPPRQPKRELTRPRRAPPPPPPTPPVAMLHLDMMQLSKQTCHFPIGDGPFTYCGHDTKGETYCAFHARAIHIPRRRRAA